MDLQVEESGLVFCGLFCRVAASPYPTYKTVGPVSAAPPDFFYSSGGIVGTCGASSISFCVMRNASG
ncbi:MAG TPA: hypothetical protein DEU90_00520 [Enterobacter asburiae]|nr:hypothetical protein DP195_07320 [Enterobacter asburiae]HBW92955.1 hypothetical protein [Enterobacter asburiae]HCF66051.1 hypothetical protein [Enterobacter asburiae]